MIRTAAAQIFAIAALWVSIPAHSSTAEDPQWQFGTSISFLNGDYGEPTDTDLVYIPITAKRYFSRGDVTLTVPFLDISSGGGTAFWSEHTIGTDSTEKSLPFRLSAPKADRAWATSS